MIVKVLTSVVYPILFVRDPDPDLTFQRVSYPDLKLIKVPDSVWDPTLNNYSFSGTTL
jgi:hypothetical protein